MINYFIYRISTNYNGFVPSRILHEAKNGKLTYNWNAYFDSVDKGDIIITHFHGAGCKKGIYAISRISDYKYTTRGNKVIGRVIISSSNNYEPLISFEDGNNLLSELFSLRQRGAEIVVPASKEENLFSLLNLNRKIISSCKKLNIVLPGSPNQPAHDITEIPKIRRRQVNRNLINRGIISAFWIRPRQASWIRYPPNWLPKITGSFEKFKAGDLSVINEFADALGDRVVEDFNGSTSKIGLITGVPLNAKKKAAGEIDRVSVLAKLLSERLRIPYKNLLKLNSNISRRLYKLRGYTTTEFEEAYLKKLYIGSRSILKEIRDQRKELLLIDDVYTDGVTTRTITKAIKEIPGMSDLKIKIATLGVMVKKRNLSNRFAEKLSG